MVTDHGCTIFLVPRRFESEVGEIEVGVGWMEVSGVGVLRKKDAKLDLDAVLRKFVLPIFD
jgi:hypothetical protein